MTESMRLWVKPFQPAPTAAMLVLALAYVSLDVAALAAQLKGPSKRAHGAVNVTGTPSLVVSLAPEITPYRLASTCTAANPLLTFFLQVANRGTGPSPAQPAAMLVAADVGLSPPWTGQAVLPAIDPGQVVSVTVPVMVYSPSAAVTGTDTFTFAVRGASSPTRANAGTPPVMLVLTIPPGLCTSAPGHGPVPTRPAPPGSTLQGRMARPRAKLTASARAEIASSFSASEFRAQALKYGKLVRGPVITVPHQPQLRASIQTNKIPTLTPTVAQGPLQLGKTPVAEDQGIKLTFIPSTEAALVEGMDKGCIWWTQFPPLGGDDCAVVSTSMSTPTSTDSMFPGRTVAVTETAKSGIAVPDTLMGMPDVFSFKHLSPGFWVTSFQIESRDLSQAMPPICTAEFKGWDYVHVDAPDNPPVAIWDDKAKAIKVWAPHWYCVAYANSYFGWVDGSSAAYYAITVWVSGPKGGVPWGGNGPYR